MIRLLIDHNIEGQAVLLQRTLTAEGWDEIFPIRMSTFEDVGLAWDTNDRDVWRFAQSREMVLLTDNRNMKGEDSLEQTLREENTETSLPVLSIARTARLDERIYRERCVYRLLEIGMSLESFRGTGRIFIP